MFTGKLTEFDLAARLGSTETVGGPPMTSAIALALMQQIKELAAWAEPAELDYIAWRLAQLTNDLAYAAARAAERTRA